jgi:hypothetical protein
METLRKVTITSFKMGAFLSASEPDTLQQNLGYIQPSAAVSESVVKRKKEIILKSRHNRSGVA